MANDLKKDGELSILVERTMRFIQLLRIYELVLTIPAERDCGEPHLTMRGTMLSVVYSFFYSLVERDEKSVDFFRTWSVRRPEFCAEIAALEAQVDPMRDALRLYRNRFGFHGSISRAHEASAFDLLELDGATLYKTMLDLRNLSTRLVRASVTGSHA